MSRLNKSNKPRRFLYADGSEIELGHSADGSVHSRKRKKVHHAEGKRKTKAGRGK